MMTILLLALLLHGFACAGEMFKYLKDGHTTFQDSSFSRTDSPPRWSALIDQHDRMARESSIIHKVPTPSATATSQGARDE